MKQHLLKLFVIFGAGAVGLNATAAPVKRIGVVEDPVVKIYALGATASNLGVYTLSATEDAPEKISGSTRIQYSFMGSGGTFVDENTVYGTEYKSRSTYAVIAKAEGTEDGGPWNHTFYNYRTMPGYVDIPATSLAKDMTYSPADEKIYGIFKAGQYSTSWVLATYDGETFATSKIGDLPYGTTYSAIAADGEGNLYAIDADMGQLVSIDKTTAAVTTIGSLGVITKIADQSAAIDASTGKMYWIARASDYSPTQSLYEVDLTTGKATKLYDVTSGRYSGLFIPAPKASATAPAAAENLAAEFTGQGTDMKITFTMPSTTFGGTALTGDVDYTIYCDGAEVATGTAEAGTEVEKVLALEAGEREISVICSKGEEKSPRAKISTLVGFDVPTNISDLKAESDGNTVTLTWTAPTAAHGGVLDESKLSYTVTRTPGNVELVSGLKECTYTDEVPDGNAALYTYTVTVKYDGTDDRSLTTDGIMLGNPYQVPYAQNFDSAGSLGDVAFAQYSVVADSPRWTLGETDGNKYVEIEAKYYNTHDDYLFSGPIEFAKGVKYTLKFKLAATAASPTYYDWSTGVSVEKQRPFVLSVFLTKGQSHEEADRITPALGDDIEFTCTQENVGVFAEQTMSFTVAETGVYNVCFLDKSEWYLLNISLRLDDIEITAEYPKPAPVTDLTTTPGEENNRDITVSFNAPQYDVDGAPLESLTSIEVYRGSALIATLTEGVAPGAKMTYVDENAPRGIHSYHVVAVNATEKSEAAYSSVRSGYINNLAITECDVPERIASNTTGKAVVTITNDAFETAVDYRVAMYINDTPARSAQGESISPDQTLTYEFTIDPAGEKDMQIKVKFVIEFPGDEYLDNNTSAEYPVLIEGTSAIADLTADGEVTVTGANGQLTVAGAEGLDISIHTADGRTVGRSTAHGNVYTVRLQPGVYVVAAGHHTFKISL